MFLGIDLSHKGGVGIILAILAAATQYFQIKLSVPSLPPAEKDAKPSFKNDFGRSFNTQMRYILPVIVFGIGSSLPSAVALYWVTSNLFSITHELYVKRKAKEIVA